MPLLDNEINKSKSAFKIKQYLACGVPALASDVGDNKLFIKDGEDGFLCHDKNDWLKYINYFYNLDAKSYLEFIKKSRESFLEGDFNLEKAAKKFYQFLKDGDLNL
jgi:glycosyltransferase involved in cell wall biosynthesis